MMTTSFSSTAEVSASLFLLLVAMTAGWGSLEGRGIEEFLDASGARCRCCEWHTNEYSEVSQI